MNRRKFIFYSSLFLTGSTFGLYKLYFNYNYNIISGTKNGSLFINNLKNSTKLIDIHENIYSMTYSPDNKKVIIGSNKGNIYIYSLNPVKLESTIDVTSTKIRELSFSPDGTKIAVGADDNIVYIYSIHNDKLYTKINNANGNIWSIEFISNNSTIAYSSNDGNIYVHNIITDDLVTKINGSKSTIYTLDISSDGTKIVYGDTYGNVYIYSTLDWTKIREYNESSDAILSLSFSPNNSYLLYGSRDRNLYIQSSKSSRLIKKIDTDKIVYDVSFYIADKFIICGLSDSILQIYNTNNWSLEKEINHNSGDIYAITTMN